MYMGHLPPQILKITSLCYLFQPICPPTQWAEAPPLVTTPNPSEVILGFREGEKMVVLANPSADKQELPRFRPPKVKALRPACLVLIDGAYRSITMARSDVRSR